MRTLHQINGSAWNELTKTEASNVHGGFGAMDTISYTPDDAKAIGKAISYIASNIGSFFSSIAEGFKDTMAHFGS